MSFSESISPLIGRVLLCWVFVSEAFAHLGEWNANVALLDAKGVPAAPAVLGLTLGAMIFGGASLLAGFQTRFSAMALAVCSFGWSFLLHDYWMIADEAARAADRELFLLGIAVTAGLLVLAGFGGGGFAFDNTGRKKR